MRQQQIYTNIDFHGMQLVVIGGAWLAGIVVAASFPLPALFLLVLAASSGVLLLLLWHDKQGRLLMLITIGFLCGAWRYTIARPDTGPQSLIAAIGTGSLQLQGTVSDEPTLAGRTRLLTVTVNGISRQSNYQWTAIDGQIEVQTLDTSLDDPYAANYGDTVVLQGKLLPPSSHSLRNISASMFLPGVSIESSGGNPIIACLYHLRILLATAISQALPEPAAALLIAILLGLHTPELELLTQAFSVSGTAHLIAASGFKVTLLAGQVASSVGWLSKKRTRPQLPAEKLRDWRRWLTTLLVISSIGTYTLLNGAGPAALRAGIMGCILVLASRLGRTYNIYAALALAAILMSLIDPFLLWDISFQLSFLGTLGIVLLTPYIQRLLLPLKRIPCGDYVSEIVAVTLAAQIATWPLEAVYFGEISLIAPLTNILTVPLLSIVILLGVLVGATGLVFTPLAQLCGWVAWPLLWYISHIVTQCAKLPWAYIPANEIIISTTFVWGYYLILACTVLALRIRWPLKAEVRHTPTFHIPTRTWHIVQLGAACLILVATGLVVVTPQQPGLLRIDFLDVGPTCQPVQSEVILACTPDNKTGVGPACPPAQGEAILIRTPDHKTALIDGGLDATSLAQELDSRLPPWQRSLDIVLLTTPRTDHITGLQDIITRYSIEEVIDAGMLHPSTTYARWRRTISERNLRYVPAVQGMTIPLGSQVALQVLWPGAHLHQGSNEVRDNGLILRLVAPGMHILLLGASAQSPYALAGLISDFNANFLHAEIVQMIGETDKAVPAALTEVLRMAHPSLIVVTPAALSAAQRKASPAPAYALPVGLSSAGWQVVQTAKLGTLEITGSKTAWNKNIQTQDCS